ncbi:hypothetical protein ACQZV8_04360 [Magnetococcales bacterium HHB-1]
MSQTQSSQQNHSAQPSERMTQDDLANIRQMRMPQNFAEQVSVQRAILKVPVCKPHRQEFFQIHPDPSWRLETMVLDLKEERETFLVAPPLWHELQSEITAKILISTMNRNGTFMLWPIRLPGEDGQLDDWNRSALEALEIAEQFWIRLKPNQNLGAYEVMRALNPTPAPVWPEITFDKLLEIAFRDKFIQSMDHPVLRRLRGEA